MNQQLFCKPRLIDSDHRVLFSKHISEPQATIGFRSLNLSHDLDMIFGWVNRAYSKRFWQLNGSKALVETTYRLLLQDPGTHSFIGLLNGKPVCQIDVYLLAVDELRKEVIDLRENDCGFHLLMAPPRETAKGLSKDMLRTFFEYFFSFEKAERLFGEPDKDNVLANRLAVNAGMEFLYPVQLTYKTANLWAITKSQFTTQQHATLPNY